LAASVAWLGYVVLHAVASGRWWPMLLPDLAPPPVFLAVPLVLLALAPLARPAHRWIVTTALAALLVGAGSSGLNPAALVSGPGRAPADAVHIVSWNTEVWNLTDPPDRFYAFLQSQHADVYLLQEYNPQPDAAGQRADDYRLHAAFPGYTAVVRGELLTLSRLPVLATKALPAEPPPGADFTAQYNLVKALRTDLRVGAGTLSVYNVHIPIPLDVRNPLTPGFYREVHRRFDERRLQYRALTDDVVHNGQPKLVAGDFNTSPAMGELQQFAGQLRDAAQTAGSPYPASWPTGWPRLWRLDWAFTSPSVGVYRYRFHNGAGLSDHDAQDLLISPGGRS
jgi:endonuclease/exonuclease/phosphatase (EEP) superfamily protein YafD